MNTHIMIIFISIKYITLAEEDEELKLCSDVYLWEVEKFAHIHILYSYVHIEAEALKTKQKQRNRYAIRNFPSRRWKKFYSIHVRTWIYMFIIAHMQYEC